jgi:unsaturated chondroitin disaccharide hydrolase
MTRRQKSVSAEFKKILNETVKKLDTVVDSIQANIPYLAYKGKWNDFSNKPSWWTNGFYPGTLWHLYQITHKEKFANYAINIEKKLDVVLNQFIEVDHDAGFIWKLTSVNHFLFKKDPHARIQALKAASILASRFNPKGEYIRAWNGEWARGHAIIDSLMNLSLLYWASKEIQDKRYYEVAVKQANTAIKEFIRTDGSAHHIVVFDDETGKRVSQRTGQGYAEHSSWGRGTAWALYGFTLSYRETLDIKYLEAAEKVANFVTKHLPEDFVPFADYLAPNEPKKKKDSSAGAITACAFLMLGKLTKKTQYITLGENILRGLIKTCLAPSEYQPLLLHGNVAYHSETVDETDIPIIYGDYFFLEALVIAADGKGFF